MSEGEISTLNPSEMINFTKYLQKYADIQPLTYWWEFPFYTIIRSARQKFCLGNRPEDLDHIATIEQRTWEKHLTHLNRLERFPLDKAEYYLRLKESHSAERIGKIFEIIIDKAEEKKIVRKVFTFVDATAIKAKETTWAERDKALEEGAEKLNNNNVGDYGADKDARFGCKGKDKFWYGYKAHASVDMGSGLIQKVAVTPANVSEQDALKLICPDGGMVIGDKAYCLKSAQETMVEKGCYSGAILKNNMKEKNKDKDRWLTRLRAPFENVFFKWEHKTRYRGLIKVQGQIFLEAIVFNVKRLLVINSPPLFAGA